MRPAPTIPIDFTMAADQPFEMPLAVELFGELRQNLEEVRHEAEVGDLEDRRLLVLVDGADHAAVLHPGEVLDRAGNADRDIEVGRHNLAGLATWKSLGT